MTYNPSTSFPDNLVNLTKLEQATGGNMEFTKKMIDIFVSDTPEQVDAMRSAMESKDFETVSKIAHKIKPSVDVLSCPEIGELVRYIEGLPSEAEMIASTTQLASLLDKLLVQLQS